MANYNIQSHHSSGNQLEENKRWIILKPHGTLRLVYVDFDIFLSIPHHYGLTNVEKSGMTTLRFACQVFRTSISPCGEFMHVSMGGQRSCWIHSPLSILTAYACLEPLHHTPTFCPTAILSLTWPTTVSYRTKTGHTLKKDLISWTRIWCGSKDDMGVWKEREREKGTKNWSECGTWKQLLGQ